ncbi:hypothetical protein [Rhizobium gallicum]|nr:hypothetical protein [Rhizobium gallicum]ULJ74554.1 hypothetical protein L2W42_20975 [Rhizobium gallicum]
MTPKKYQSGETDYSGRISKTGDVGEPRSTRRPTSSSRDRSKAQI